MSAERKFKVTTINPFTVRQVEIIEDVASGLTREDIAAIRGIKPNTVSKHISNVLGIIEDITEQRPSRDNWIVSLLDDVILRRY